MKKIFPFNKVLLAVFLIVMAGFLQNTNLINIAGIKPNLTLAILSTLAFFVTESAYYLLLVLIAVWFLRFESGLEFATSVFALVLLLVFWVRNFLPGKPFFNNLLLIALSTLLFNLVIDFKFFGGDFFTVLIEMLYNIILGGLAFFALSRLFKDEKKFRFTF